MNDIEDFRFFKNYWYLIKFMKSDKDKLLVFSAIPEYIFEDKEPNFDKNGEAYAMWVCIFPSLETTKEKILAGKKGGRHPNKRESNNTSKTTSRNASKDISKEESKTGNKTPTISRLSTIYYLLSTFILSNNYDKRLENILKNWIKYKEEKRDSYTETGFKSLLTQIKNNIEKYSEEQVIDLIEQSMANNWKGIQFQILKEQPKKREVKYL